MLNHVWTSLSFIFFIFQCVRTMVVSTMVVLHLANFKKLMMFELLNCFTIIVGFHWCDLFNVHYTIIYKIYMPKTSPLKP